jgi:hypothetical protein
MHPSEPKALKNAFDRIQRIRWQTGFLLSSAWAAMVHGRHRNTLGGPCSHIFALSYMPDTLQGTSSEKLGPDLFVDFCWVEILEVA